VRMSPGKAEGAALTAPSNDALGRVSTRRIYPSRSVHKRESAQRRAAFDSLGAAAAPADQAQQGEPARRPGSLLLAPGATAQDAWVAWLAPRFADNGSCYFTGTYSDDYGVPNGLMNQRNVFKDFRRFLESFRWDGHYIVAVEKHAYRDVLHLHAILQGDMTDEQRAWIRTAWACERGHARSLPVLDGCASYVTKYALKNDADAFEWRLS
jgi:hypothetical protein